MDTLKLYEEYINSGSNRLTTLLRNLVQSLNASFSGTNNVLGEKDLESLALIDIEQSNSNDAFEKNILMRFSDQKYHYQMIFVVKLDDVDGNKPITKGYMKLKIYDGNQATMIREWQSDMSIHEATDEEINEEGRYFVKVGEIKPVEGQAQEGQEEIQAQSENMDFIESFIVDKLGFLKDAFETENDSEEGPQLQDESEAPQE